VIGMLLTPPDIISQTMLAIPMLLLFELGIIIASIYHTEDQDNQGSSSDIKEKSL
jgi:sec-independent protein translocase protein TatC